MLRQMVDVRAAQGYSVWKGETFVINGAQGGNAGGIANAGGYAWGKGGMYGELRPGFWQAMDDVVAYINSQSFSNYKLQIKSGARSGFEMCSVPSTKVAGVPNQNTSRIQHKEV